MSETGGETPELSERELIDNFLDLGGGFHPRHGSHH